MSKKDKKNKNENKSRNKKNFNPVIENEDANMHKPVRGLDKV
ncbi:MAG: hypothetical protein ACERKV_05905 [Clostridiaceae bacterium]